MIKLPNFKRLFLPKLANGRISNELDARESVTDPYKKEKSETAKVIKMEDISVLLAPCGLYCGWCPYYVQGTKEFKCPGCWEREKCGVRDCAKSKGLKLCTYCSSFPCEKLPGIYAKMPEFFERIKKDFPNGISSSS